MLRTISAWRLAILFSIAAILSAVALPSDASAFPQDQPNVECGSGGTVNFWINPGDFTPAERSAIDGAAKRWEIVLNESGTIAVDMVRLILEPTTSGTQANPNIKINSTSTLPTGVNGRGRCEDREILLADTLPLANLPAVTRHEMGHILGLAHTGTTDNLISNGVVSSAMATCLTPSTVANRDVGIDDFGQLHQKRTGTLNSNAGIEYSTPIFWIPFNLDLWSSSTNTIPKTGQRSLYIKPQNTAAGGKVFSPANFASSSGAPIRARADIRLPYTTPGNLTGSVQLLLMTRPVIYGSAQAPPACETDGRWATTRDQNNRVSTGSWVIRKTTSSFPNSMSWSSSTTAVWTIPTGTAALSKDVRIDVVSNRRVQGSNASVWVAVDNIRLYEA